MQIYKNLKKCRICASSDLTEVVKIDDQHLSPTFVKSNEGHPLSEVKVPHTLMLCGECSLLQLKETVEPDLLYKQYFYRSAVSDTMKRDLKDVVDNVLRATDVHDNDYVLDIGANDCTMVSYFPETLNRCGIEPAENIDWSHVDDSITIVNDYFTEASVRQAVGDNKVKVFTSCAMFYDIDDPNSFVEVIKNFLDPEGVFCVQLSYLPAMLRNINFYDICNEHLEYYSLITLENLMRRHGLEIYDASENQVNGGSVRIMVTHVERALPKTVRLLNLFRAEREMRLDSEATYVSFHNKILDMKNKIKDTIGKEIGKGNLVIGLGGSTKGNMLLQTFGIGKETIPFISERNPDKVGLRTLGTDIELISEEAARALTPAYMLVLPWYFKEEIVDREKDYLESGGKLLIPMPYPHIVHKDGETVL